MAGVFFFSPNIGEDQATYYSVHIGTQMTCVLIGKEVLLKGASLQRKGHTDTNRYLNLQKVTLFAEGIFTKVNVDICDVAKHPPVIPPTPL